MKALSNKGYAREMVGASQVAQMVKNLPAVQEICVWSLTQKDLLEKEGSGYPLQFSCLENSMNRRAWL